MNNRLIAVFGVILTAAASLAAAQSSPAPAPQAAASPTPAVQAAPSPTSASTVTCVSVSGERQVCVANTSAGVALQQSTGASTCLLGKTWGYDDRSVWVSDRCGGVFTLGQVTGGRGASHSGGGAANDEAATA